MASADQNLWPPGARLHHPLRPRVRLRRRTVPRVDVLHLHHAVWAVNGAPQFAAGEEKTIQQLPRGSAGAAAHRHLDTSTTCCTTSSPSRPRSTSSGGSTSSRRQLTCPARLDKAGAHQVDGRRREPELLSRSSTRCGSTARTAPTRSPIRRPPSDLQPCGGGGGRLRGRRAATAASEPPRAGRRTRRDADRHRRAPAPRRPRHAAARYPRRGRPTRSSPPTPTTTSRRERSPGTSRWGRHRLPGAWE